MSEVKQYRCDFPGCSTITEKPHRARIGYARTEDEVKALVEIAKKDGIDFIPEPALFEKMQHQSAIEKTFDLCDVHYAKLKSDFFGDPEVKAETPKTE